MFTYTYTYIYIFIYIYISVAILAQAPSQFFSLSMSVFSMALYYCEGLAMQRKVIDFGSMADLVAASTQAFLGYSSMKQAASACKETHLYLYVALTGFRWAELSPDLCGACGWLTGRQHCQAVCTDICSVSFVCRDCIQQEGVRDRIAKGLSAFSTYALLRNMDTGISPEDLLKIQAWYFSDQLSKAIFGGQLVYSLSVVVPWNISYPYSVSQVVPWNVDGVDGVLMPRLPECAVVLTRDPRLRFIVVNDNGRIVYRLSQL